MTDRICGCPPDPRGPLFTKHADDCPRRPLSDEKLAALDGRRPEVELRDRATGGTLKHVARALVLLDEGHATLAREAIELVQAELEAQEEAWTAVRALLGEHPHVCTCGDTDGEECDGCVPSGFEDRCRYEQALRQMAGFDA